MLHRVNYRSAAFGSESVAFEEPDQRVRKVRSETMGLRVKSDVTFWRAARRVQSVSPPPPLSCADLIRASIYHAARSSVSPRRTGLRIQEPPDQEALHVTAAIGNQIDDHTPLLDAIDQPVGLEEDLAKLGDAEVGKLARMAPALRKLGKVDQRLFDAFENIGRALARKIGRARV